jgi:hypothetical protein
MHIYAANINCCVFYSYPLLNVPLPGNAPLEYNTYKGNYSMPSRAYNSPADETSDDLIRPRWVGQQLLNKLFDLVYHVYNLYVSVIT